MSIATVAGGQSGKAIASHAIRIVLQLHPSGNQPSRLETSSHAAIPYNRTTHDSSTPEPATCIPSQRESSSALADQTVGCSNNCPNTLSCFCNSIQSLSVASLAAATEGWKGFGWGFACQRHAVRSRRVLGLRSLSPDGRREACRVKDQVLGERLAVRKPTPKIRKMITKPPRRCQTPRGGIQRV